jgi:hypothetical protein
MKRRHKETTKSDNDKGHQRLSRGQADKLTLDGNAFPITTAARVIAVSP